MERNEMKSNPFYFASAAAMLAGCYILGQALELQPGHLGKLLLLMGVVQVYECLLVGLGLMLVVRKRAAGDGMTLLGLECVFLLDATLLGNECATVDVFAGTAASVLVVTLGVLKLLVARRFVPHLVTTRAALILGVHATVVQALPVVVAQAASARWLTPAFLYGLWWLTLGLPVAKRRLFDALPGSTRARRAFLATLPGVSVFVHLVAAGWVHDIAPWPAFLAPLLLGLALVDWDEKWLYVALPAMALLFSIGQDQLLGWLLGAEGVSPARLVLLVIAAGIVVRAWLLGLRWLVASGSALALAGILGTEGIGSLMSIPPRLLGWLVRFVGPHLPKGAAGWGVVTVALAFLLLALGLHRSLKTHPPQGGNKW
jgi:hypothetical protein